MLEDFQRRIDGIKQNGHPTERLPHNLNVYIPGIEAKALLLELKDEVSLSTGSACATTKIEPSHVIDALGFRDDRTFGSVRFGLGRSTTHDDIQFVADIFVSTVNQMKRRFRIS